MQRARTCTPPAPCGQALEAPRSRQQAPEAQPGGVFSQALPSHSQPPALSQLVSLYLGRSHFLWKEPATMSWLEENVREVLQAVDAGDPAVEACESRWAGGRDRAVLGPMGPTSVADLGGVGWAPLQCCPCLRGPRRKALYQRAPRNIHRHVVLSEIKEAVAALPPVSGGCPRSFLRAGLPPRWVTCRHPRLGPVACGLLH